MTLETKNFTHSVVSLDNETERLKNQESIQIHKHRVKKGYLILSKNDFGKVKTRVNPGYFNKKTNFIVGEEKSLMVLNKETLDIESPNTSEIIKNQKKYFLIYPLTFIKEYNSQITVYDKQHEKSTTFLLNYQFGVDLGEFLKKYTFEFDIPKEYEILKAIISTENNRLNLNKQLLVNSNFEFLIGILDGYLADDKTCIINTNINIYNFTYILNLLGAQYSIRKVEENMNIRFKLPMFLSRYSNLHPKFFREYKYVLRDNEIRLEKVSPDIPIELPDVDIYTKINTGIIELIPAKDLKFIEIDETIMYDLTMPDINSQNYSMGLTPLLKNSDGDILGIIGMHTKDAANECAEKFGVELKKKFLSLNNASVQNWGIKLDAALGLYNATK